MIVVETESHCAALTGLKLYPSVSTGIIGILYHTKFKKYIYQV
jgi:hypothetical protein